MIVGCYTLHLYCDRGECADGGTYTPEEFTAEHGSECRKQARKRGWIITEVSPTA
jgi:hypothetical protein